MFSSRDMLNKMACIYGTLHYFLLFFCVTVAFGYEDIQTVFNQVSSLQSDLLNRILPEYIHSQVEQALSQILGDKSIYDRMNHLKHSHQNLERHLHKMDRRVKFLENQRNNQMETIRKCNRQNQNCETQLENLKNEQEKKETYKTQIDNLREQLNVTRHQIVNTEDALSSLRNIVSVMNESAVDTCRILGQETDLIRQNLTSVANAHVSDIDSLRNNFTETYTLNMEHVDAVAKELKTSINFATLRLENVEERTLNLFNNLTLARNRVDRKFSEMVNTCRCDEGQETNATLLLVQLWSGIVRNPHQLKISSNIMTEVSHPSMSRVDSVTYDPTSRRIIFSRFSPDGIYSSRLDVRGVETLKSSVKSYGLTVDVQRRLIFMTTAFPVKSISRMTTHGEDFHTIVDLGDYGTYTRSVRGISIDAKQEVIYFTTDNRLMYVDYDGDSLNILEDEGEFHSVVFDPFSNSLFFDIGRKVMMKSLSTLERTELMELNLVLKLALYNNNLYISQWDGTSIDVIHLGNKSHSTLRNMPYKNNDIVFIT